MIEPIRVSTRSWCRAYVVPTPGGTAEGPLAPIPQDGAAWAEAYAPAPITWGVLVFSSLPVSNLAFSIEVAGPQGGWQSIPGLVTPPFLGGPPIPGTAVRVLRQGGGATPGERIVVTIAPVVWPAWMVPEWSELQSRPGLWR